MIGQPHTTDDLARAFGRGVRETRTRQGLTQKQLSAQSFIAANTIGCLERGRVGLALYSALALSQALGVTVDELVRLGLEEVET